MNPSYWLFGSKLQILQSEKDTEGRYDLIEGLFLSGAQSPLHVHTQYSETIIVQEGEIVIYMPGEQHILKAGESFFIPPNVPHVVANNSATEPFKALALASPSGFARLVRSVGIPDDADPEAVQQPHDMELAYKVMAEVGDAILGPPGARP
jgi:mannose-6-phosphate isomerase-like protein (cupin superfamily)